MKAQKNNPKYSYMENLISNELGQFISGVIKKNRSYGQLTSKALSEIDKMSNMSPMGKGSVDGMTVLSKYNKSQMSPGRSESSSPTR